MKTTLTIIGNSKGIIIPATLLKECQIDYDVTIEVKNNKIVISKPVKPRSGWADAFAQVKPNDQEILIDDDLTTSFENGEWEW